MSKKNRLSGAKKCVCDRCNLEAHSIPDTVHRRCSGDSSNSTPRLKHEKIVPALRGRWH